jgi:hypothetical protein
MQATQSIGTIANQVGRGRLLEIRAPQVELFY